MMAPRHELIKGPLRPPKPDLLKVSYTQPPASKDEVSVKVWNKGKIPGESEFANNLSAVEFPSQAVPQPFLDPSIIQRRIQLDKQRKAEAERAKSQIGPSGPSQDP
jgi:hypothetical protein